MFKAVAVATIAVKSQHRDLTKARSVFLACLDQQISEVPREDVGILLKQHSDPAEALRIGLARETAPVDERYRTYQTLLHQRIARQQGFGRYHHILIEEGDESHRKIQDNVRRIVAAYALPKVFAPLMSTVRKIYAVGGLSECGKSTVAALISSHYGSAAHRLKNDTSWR